MGQDPRRAAIGLIAATAIGAAIGGLVATTLSSWLTPIKIGGGILFIAIGVWTIAQGLRRHFRPEAEEPSPDETRGAFVEALSFNFLAEFGDKTQIAVILLAASLDAPVSVFLGASLGLCLVAVSSVLIGAALARVLTEKWLRVISTVLFIAAGVLLIVEAFFEL